MSPLSQAVMLSWSVPPAASFALVLTAVVYLRGWFLLHRARVPFVPGWRAVSFLLGLLTIWVALASPLDTYAAFLITAHMLQHMLLMMVAPPLLLLGAPLIPLVRGLPIFAAREFAGPFLNWRVVQGVGRGLCKLWVALVLMGVVMSAWHTPRLYEFALASSAWHQVEHACFFLVSLIFWWPAMQPWPSRAHAPRWAVVPYLLIADVQNTILSAILVFSDRVLYPSYAVMPRLFGLSAQHDQAASGAIMWVVGSLAFLVPAVMIAVQWLSSRESVREIEALPGRVALEPWSLDVWLRGRVGGRKLEAITFIALFAVAGVTWAALAAGSSDDDDQVLRMQAVTSTFIVSVFGPPEFETGSNSVAVLVQDRSSGEFLQEAQIGIRAGKSGDSAGSEIVRASTGDENKLLQSAEVELPTKGEWILELAVHRGADSAELRLPVAVAKPARSSAVAISFIVLLILAALLGLTYWWRHRAGPVLSTSEKNEPAGSVLAGDRH